MQVSAALRRGLSFVLLAGPCLRSLTGAGADPEEAAPAPPPAIVSIGEVRFVPRGEDPRPAVFSAEAIRRWLAREIGSTCAPGRIEESVAASYRALGYVPLVRATCGDGDLRLVIRESSHRIALVTLDPADLSRIGMSPGEHLPDERLFYPVPSSAPRAVLLGILQTRPGDLYNVERYRVDRDALERLGYSLLFIPGPKAPEDAYPDGALLVQSVKQRAEDPEARGQRLNYLGGTASYEPRSGGTVGLVYQRRDLFEPLDRLTISPTYYSTEAGGEITYAAPLLADRETPRRLYDIDVGVYSHFRNDRLLEGQEVDERRSGVFVTLGARPLGLAAPHELRIESGVRRELVRFSDPAPGEEDIDLTLVRLGATHVWHHTYLPPGLTIRSIPSVELSLDAGGGAPFIRPGLSSYLHSRMRSGFEVDLHLAAGGIDRPVPQSELFSLGGVASVRGFQEDTRLGRGIAALQSEIWIPFARPLEGRPIAPDEADQPSTVPVEPMFARRLKAAVFLDAGTIWQSTAGARESIYGAGIGVRFVVPHEPLVVRIDYGWGLGAAGDSSYPYVSIGYTH